MSVSVTAKPVRIWPAAADGFTLTTGASAFTFGDWVQVATPDDVSNAVVIAGFMAGLRQIGGGGSTTEIQLGIGETDPSDIGKFLVVCAGSGAVNMGMETLMLRPPVDKVPAGSRVWARARNVVGLSVTITLAVLYFDSFDVSAAVTTGTYNYAPYNETGAAITPSGTAWESSADWVELVPSLAENGLLLGVGIIPGVGQGGEEWEVDLAVGAAGSESVVTTVPGILSDVEFQGFTNEWITGGYPVAAGDRISAKLRMSGTDTSTVYLYLLYIGDLGTDEVEFVNDRIPGLTHIEITMSDGTVEPWAVIPMDDPLDYDYGRKPPRVLAWGDIRRAASDFYGVSVAADFRFTVRDKDLHVLGYLGNPEQTFTNRYTVTRSIGDTDRRQQLTRRVIFRGPIRSVTPRAGATHEFVVKDYLQERFGPNSDIKAIPRRKVLKDDFPGCETVLVNSSAEGYVVNGALGLTQDLGDGPVPTTVIGVRAGFGTFSSDQITFAGHATVYTVSSSTMDDPETEITINPALTAAIVDGELITQTPTHRVTAAKGNVVPVRPGLITDRNVIEGIDVGDGRGKPLYVGDEVMTDGHTYGMWVWACHGCYAPSGRPIIQPYWWEEALDNLAGGTFYYNDVAMAMTIGDLDTEAGSGGRVLFPGYGNWTANGFTMPHVDRNGRRYVIYGLRGIFRDWALGIRQAPQNLGGVAHAVNAWGMDSNLDSTGSAVRDPHDQFQLLFNNFAWGDYQRDLLPDPTFPDDATLTLLDLASFTRTKAQAATLVDGGFVADWSFGVDNEQITMAEFITRGVLSMGAEQSWNRKAQFMIDRQVFDEDTAMADAPTLTDERDIKKGSYEIDERPSELFTSLRFVHTRDELGRVASGWRSSTADFNVSDQADEYADATDIIERYSPSGTKLYSQPLQFYWLSGMNRETDAPEYQQGSDTINAILAYKLAMAKVRVFTLTTWGRGYSIDVFDKIWIQHFANVGWRIPRPARVIEHDAQPDRWRVTLKCFDLRNAFGATRHTLTVGFGSGDGLYYPGTRVAISASAAPSGTAFYRWDGAVVEDATALSTYIRMPASNTTVSATFLAPYNYIIQVPVGALNVTGVEPAILSQFRVIAVPIGVSRADAIASGDVPLLVNNTLDLVGYAPTVALKFTTIAVPVGAVGLTGLTPTIVNSSFKTIAVPVGTLNLTGVAPAVAFATGHTVTVENGTPASAHYVDTTVVAIVANAAPSGKVFDAWTHATVANAASASTTLTVGSGQPRAINLNWNANAPADLVEGYVVVWGTTPGVYPNSRDAGNVLTYWLTGLTMGVTYYIAIKAYNATDYSGTSVETSGVADTILVTATYR